MLSTSISVTGSSPPATHKRSSRTSSRGITFRNVNPQSGNGVEKIEHVEHKFKPTIMKKEFNWDLPADPDPKSDNYYNGIVSKELKEFSNVAEVLLGVIRRESVINQSDFVNEGIETILDRLGIKSDKPLTRKEKLLAFIGFKAGSMWEGLMEIQRQIEPASPNPIEMVMMGILKTNGKKC
nr:MAG: hypothetical protein [Bacteriophage sp.]